ncbi:uncharacterized protein Z519_07626 [Cladophialophora bantiana CBS 173.52]|uniref:Uncharacterized protein n=1 Tax=Cladophialophora bantiana (strain ATCC 10958 / CBS 173.52 / CDC B-1940 / NIH 8579) TaxID=1442370 RepID=A0A0D2HEE2_CLAB1|nr:uncharacterized protein Z519_07626 [Cladophialophora bantiana CBS 173.52]KIW91658.1 hypothetical protein Z519_07626 [Cladophialophora bantiana CBS 173.52]
MATSATRSTVRRAPCRDRRARRRPRRRESQMPPLGAHNQRGPKRRKLRDLDSLNLDNCYYACEDRGYHLDPDVRVGLEVSQDADGYWLPEDEITDSTAIEEELFPWLEYYSAGMIESPELPTLPATWKRSVFFRRKETRRPPQTDLLTGSVSSLLPSTPATANATPVVKMPGCHLESSMNGCPLEYCSDYLNDVRIPSPLLYHNSQLQYVPPSDDARSNWNNPCFEFAYGQQKPEPDFTSYRPTAGGSIQAELADLPRRESLGFALCTAASSRHKPEASHISDGSHDSSTYGDPPSSLVDCPDSRRPTGNIQYHPSTGDVHNAQSFTSVGLEPFWYNDYPKRQSSRRKEANVPRDVGPIVDNLIFPTLPTPPCHEDKFAVDGSINRNTVQPEANQATSDWEQARESSPSSSELIDKPPPRSIPDAEVAALCAVRRRREAQATRLSPSRKEDRSTSGDAPLGATAKVAFLPCTDLVPARLYQHQFVAWPPSISAANITEEPDNISAVLKAIDWLEELDMLKPYAGGRLGLSALSLRPDERESDSRTDISTPEATSRPVSPVPIESHGALWVEEADSGRHDEGFSTDNERYSEVGLLDETLSEEDWANWDWDFEEDVDERIGLFATEWEAASEERLL